MPITRKFLDWSKPALPEVGDYLIDEYSILGVADFSNVIVVLPGRRAGRRLLEILVERGEQLTPPVITTLGRLPELLYESKKPFASQIVQEFAWVRALRRIDRELVQQVIARLPSDSDVDQWISLARLLAAQHRELAGDGFDFNDVVNAGPKVDGFAEGERWQILSAIQAEYLKTLDELDLWDRQTARLFAVQHDEYRTDQDIVLVATADMNRVTRQMLDQVADRVTALVHAPQSLSKRFDEHGCIVPDAWQNVTLDLKTEQVRVVDGPADQADEVARSLAAYGGRYRADEISIGFTDELLVPQIQRQLTEFDVSSRWVIGKSLSQTAPFRLLNCVADYIESQSFADFRALVRHPDLFRWIEARRHEIDDDGELSDGISWISQFDDYYNEHLQPRLTEWLGQNERHLAIKTVAESVDALLDPFLGDLQNIADWTESVIGFLLNVYSNCEWDREDTHDRVVVHACTQIQDALLQNTAIPAELAPEVTAYEAIRMTLDQLDGETIPPLPDEEAIELLGWLELPLDDAPVLIVTTFNEGHVPKSLNSDMFLPNRLRLHLGVDDNDRRFARDAYALSVLLASRKNLQLIVARRDGNDDALKPSRLLFATKPNEIADRVLAFFSSERESKPVLATAVPPASGPLKKGSDPLEGVKNKAKTGRPERVRPLFQRTASSSGFKIPRPEPLQQPLERISVTAFRTYLTCPYRFYLQYVLKLRDQDDSAKELDALQFGSLIHDVLKWFGLSEVRHSTNSNEIRQYLKSSLNRSVRETYGSTRLAPLNVQIMQIQSRLDAFAEWQADWSKQGWNIEHTEISLSDKAAILKIDETRAIGVSGRIDRIDRFRDEDRWTIFDYKSGDSAKTPEQAHQAGGEWVDLQLPLYRRMAEQFGVTGNVDLGYIVLPKDTTKVGHLLAAWTDGELAEAEARAVLVARSILNEEFWPPGDVPQNYFSEFAAICQDGVFDREVVA